MNETVVAIAGAGGFVGKALINALSDRHPIIALGRNIPKAAPAQVDQPLNKGTVTWRKCDLFSLLDVEKGLAGAHVAYYLVHSMIPSAKLTQGNFVDMDLILADNFARAAKKAGVRQIIYLTGLLPEDSHGLSDHLRSRYEVEQALSGHGVPVTALRAGLVVGPGGSSFDMMLRLVQRLPVMILPAWTNTRTQPVSLKDIIKLLTFSLDNPKTFGRVYDVGSPDVLTYRQMLEQTAQALGVKRNFINIPFVSPRLSRYWIRMITGVPLELISPLVDSLRHPMIAGRRELQELTGIEGQTFLEAVTEAIAVERHQPEHQYKKRPPLVEKDVRSVQRLILPVGKDARWVAKRYAHWLPEFMSPLLRVDVNDEGSCFFYIRGISSPLLVLSYSQDRSSRDRTLYYITGGLLVQRHPGQRGRLEFRQVLNDRYVLVAIHDFSPTLPWYIYNLTQALVHLWVMNQFGRHMIYLDQLVKEDPASVGHSINRG